MKFITERSFFCMVLTVVNGLEMQNVVMTPNPIHASDPPEEHAETVKDVLNTKRKSLIPNGVSELMKRSAADMPNASMLTVGAIVFIGDTSRGILFPILSTLCHRLGGSIIDLGYLVAMFSIGRLVITVPLGYLSDKFRHRLPLLISSSILALGATLWANAYTTNRLFVLYIAQFLLGVGSGSLGVSRSFVVEQCDPKKRTEALALLTALQYAGFTVSPILGSFLYSVGGAKSQYLSFALPSYLIALLAVCSLTGLLAFFKNIPADPVEYTHFSQPSVLHEGVSSRKPEIDLEPKSSEASASVTPTTSPIISTSTISEKKENRCPKSASSDTDDIENHIEKGRTCSEVEIDKTREDEGPKMLKSGIILVIIGMCLLNVATKGSISVYETLGAEIGLLDYKMSTVTLGALISGSGAVGFCQLLLFPKFWTKHFSGNFLAHLEL